MTTTYLWQYGEVRSEVKQPDLWDIMSVYMYTTLRCLYYTEQTERQRALTRAGTANDTDLETELALKM